MAVQSHWFSVGPIVPWAQPGVGAVATQANAEVSYGPRALELMADGLGASEALAHLLAADPLAESRQVAVIDAGGGLAVHTGRICIPEAGDCQAEGVSCQANIMASQRVWPAMLEAFQRSSGELTGRLMAALEAAEAEGGDLRGRQSAAIVVVPAAGESWERVISLRVEDDPDPLAELRRLVVLDRAYKLAGRADAAAAAGSHEQAAELYQAAYELAPESEELCFWSALGAARSGDLETAVERLSRAINVNPAWGELLARLPPELHPAAPDLLAQLGRSFRSPQTET